MVHWSFGYKNKTLPARFSWVTLQMVSGRHKQEHQDSEKTDLLQVVYTEKKCEGS